MKFAPVLVLISALLAAGEAAAAMPVAAATRLSHCDAGTCLLVTGRRPAADAPVQLAGHDVTVQGARNWRVAVPLATVQAWSAPFARTIAVQVDGQTVQARLPTGLLGHVADLAFLDVRAPR